MLLATGSEAVNADNELLLEVASFVPQDKMAVNVGVHEGSHKCVLFYTVSEVYLFS